jgi:hypothetical protein
MVKSAMKKPADNSELSKEIVRTLFFFIKTDLAVHGRITPETKELFSQYKVPYPDILSLLEEPCLN